MISYLTFELETAYLAQIHFLAPAEKQLEMLGNQVIRIPRDQFQASNKNIYL